MVLFDSKSFRFLDVKAWTRQISGSPHENDTIIDLCDISRIRAGGIPCRCPDY
jgi:hypothetical protein